MNRHALADALVDRLQAQRDALSAEFATPGRVQSFIVDDLLDADLARRIHAAFPAKEQMRVRKTLKEYKYTSAQLNACDPLIEEVTFAFQDPRVVALIGAITGMARLLPDEHLYAGGISLMTKGNFLNPHLDNSHDKDVKLYRVLNLLYYVSPDWQDTYGGHLELWDAGPKGSPRTVHSRFNRLAVMATHQASWHSVSEVTHEGDRCCVSNYYFSPVAPAPHDYYHVTSFRGRPEQPMRDLWLQGDNALRQGVRLVFKQGQGVFDGNHVYKK
jgi:Rps23 Pro-64 3,4-dihydroxylase Tpa1-like proline 4-hydroxylase